MESDCQIIEVGVDVTAPFLRLIAANEALYQSRFVFNLSSFSEFIIVQTKFSVVLTKPFCCF